MGSVTVLFLALIKNICKLPFTMSGTAAMSIDNYRVLPQSSCNNTRLRAARDAFAWAGRPGKKPAVVRVRVRPCGSVAENAFRPRPSAANPVRCA